jgi:hypothetical protein
MTCDIDTTSKRRLSAKLGAGFAIAAVLAVGVAVGPARADWHDHRDHHWHDHHWTGGYYAAPPVVYGGPGYYAPPPVVYGPGVGINLPGINLNIR